MLRLPFADAQGKLMKKTLIVANWKQNFTADEAQRWVGELNKELRIKNKNLSLRSRTLHSNKFESEGNVEIVVCPPLVLIPVLYSSFIIPHSALHLGAQDVSKFEGGQYTGEISAQMLKGFVDYVIVGHSERRKHFSETDEDVAKKTVLALKCNLIPIICVSNIEQVSKSQRVKESKNIIFAYEPLAAIGTGESDTPENANDFAQKIKAEIGQNVRVLYGGSVTSKNAKPFIAQPNISGVLVGQASLDAEEFVRLCNSAIHCASGAN
jgi:triosephosphate isomerase